MLHRVHAGGALVSQLGDSVQAGRHRHVRTAEPTRPVGRAWPPDRRRAGVGQAAHLVAMPPDRLEDHCRADRVHLHAPDGVGANHRQLHPGEMDDMGDLMVGDDLFDPGEIGHVAVDPGNAAELVVIDDEAQPVRVAGEVVGDHAGPSASSRRTVQAPMQPRPPVIRKRSVTRAPSFLSGVGLIPACMQVSIGERA